MTSPRIIATWSFSAPGLSEAWSALQRGGVAIDAVEGVCRIAEADPTIDSVGYGGLPDAEGRVSLDASVMLAPDRCGGVCAVTSHLHVVSLARRVMEETDHVLLAGEGADRFAGWRGPAESALLEPDAARRWAAWRSACERGGTHPDQTRDRGIRDPARPVDRGGGALFGGPVAEAGHDTIGTLAIDTSGMLAGACSTSGMPFKQAGRVGDSPIIGHGLYVDPRAGAATATGRGELVMGVCGSFLCVEEMRRGRSPADAIRVVLERIADSFRVTDRDQVAMIAMTRDGVAAAGALRTGFRWVCADADGVRILEPDLQLLPDPAPP
ncbi:MAG: isoaspartyl peptidase/L-asparaginase [Phycisphaeraceae bacterium]|nr:isoaspartyl peptidase/L-asparaginase [Phycisphaeraceae bacterium]